MTGDKEALEDFASLNRTSMADDVDGDPVFLASSTFMMNRAAEMNPKLSFHDIKQIGLSGE